MKAPAEITTNISPHLQIVGWWRRAGYDIVGSWSTGVWRSTIVFFAARWLLMAGLRETWQFWVAVAFFWLMYAVKDAWFAHFKWSRDVYVVCRDTANDNIKGRVFKYTGAHALDPAGKYKKSSDPITAAWPSEYASQTQWQRIWAWLTGEEMEYIFLDDPGHGVSIKGSRMSPKFRKTIAKLQGEVPAKKPPVDNDSIAMLYAIRDLAQQEVLTKDQLAVYARTILGRELYVEQ